jgi:hypothetical protein
MKSAYELAMERLEKASGPTRKLTDKQKGRISDIEKIHEAKVAELKLAYEARIQSAASQEEFDTLQAELTRKIAEIEERREKEKEAVWNEE